MLAATVPGCKSEWNQFQVSVWASSVYDHAMLDDHPTLTYNAPGNMAPTPTPAPAPASGPTLGHTLASRAMPRQRRAIERRQAILDATLAILATDGLAAISTSVIAARAGVPVASVYAYFPNKFAIVAELARQTFAQGDAALDHILGQAGTGVKLSAIIDQAIAAVLNGYREVPGRRHLFSAIRNNELLDAVQVESETRMIAVTTSIITRLRPDAPARHIAAIAATAVRAFTVLQHHAVSCDDDAQLPLLVAEWRQLLLAYLQPYLPGL